MPGRPSLSIRAPPVPFLDKLADWRDGLLSSARFRRLAARFPVTRPVARRRARDLFDLCAGFVYSQVLAACLKLDLFAILSAGPQSAATLAPRLRLDAAATERLLRAAASLRLLRRRRGGRYGLGPLGAALIGNPSVAAMVAHHDLLYADLADPLALLRGEAASTALSGYWAYARTPAPAALPGERVAAYTALMAASQPLVADEILDAVPLAGRRHLLDVGGGDGSFIAAAAARHPKLAFTLFDLPPVAAAARRRLGGAGLAGRVTIAEGDFLADPLPAAADTVALVRVLHDHDDDSALAILRAARAVLPADGLLILAEPMAGARGAAPVGDAYFGFYLLAMGQGRARAPEELRTLLAAAGFADSEVRRTHVPLLTGVIVARP